MRFFIRHVLMDEASGAGGDAGAGGGAAGGDAVGAGGGASAGADSSASALAAGAATGTGAAGSFDYLPEKYRVNKDDGSLDADASHRKMGEGYSELVKRLGTVADVPKSAAEYSVTIPDNLKESIGDLAQDGLFTQFRDEMHSLGLNQKQFDGIMQRYFELVPAVADGGRRATAEQTTAALEKHWPDEGKRAEHYKQAAKAATQMARAIGVSFDELEASGLGDNPLFIRIMASLGPEMGEDTSAGASATGSSLMSAEAIKQLMASDAYRNEKDPGFAAAQKTVRAYYERKYGSEAVS